MLVNKWDKGKSPARNLTALGLQSDPNKDIKRIRHAPLDLRVPTEAVKEEKEESETVKGVWFLLVLMILI
jgi:hypothetical protein